jgi:flavin-dependent dehydrogenase
MTRARAYDVAVVGAGPAGTAAAITIRRAGLDVAVVTGTPDARARRAHLGQTAPPGTDRVVHDTFGADAFDAHAHVRSLGNRSAWGHGDLTHTDFMFNPFGTGWHLDRAAFDARLLAVTADAGVAVLPGQLEQSRRDASWVLDLRDGARQHPLAAKVVVDASGRRAVVARAHGGHVRRADRLVAVVAMVPASNDACGHASTVEAVRDGWWYTAPVPGGGRVLSFFTDPDLHPVGALGEREWFIGAADATTHVRRFAEQLGRGPGGAFAGSDATPVVVAAGATQLSAPFGTGWVAAGDAAASFDPLSSQGVLSALLTGQAAGNAAVALLADGATAPDEVTRAYGEVVAHVVADYERERARWYRSETRFSDQPFWSRRCETRSHSG